MPRTPRGDKSLATEFGSRIKAERLDQGMSQEQLAELAGVHRTYVGQVERGEVSLTLDSIVKLARGLGKDPGSLTAGL